jgi:catechol 2,3-dioxygenase-like lactoylglutathione lyase family enzyme
MPALSFAFTKIVVGDLDAAERYYGATLGLTRVAYIEFGEGTNALQEVILAVPDSPTNWARLNLIHFPNRPVPAPGETVIGFMVDDVEKTAVAMTQAGGRITVPVRELTDYRMKLAYVADPEGQIVEILQTL